MSNGFSDGAKIIRDTGAERLLSKMRYKNAAEKIRIKYKQISPILWVVRYKIAALHNLPF